MINLRLVSRIIGHLLFLEAAFMLICLIVSFLYREDDAICFSVSIFVTIAAGFVFKHYGRDSGINMGRREAYLVVTSVWIVFSLFGMFPFFVSGYINNITDAYFETMSGFSTTGASVLNDVENLPHGLLFWRTLTQWIGGLGIVFFTIAILPSMVKGSMRVYSAEATGPIRSKMHPRLSTDARWILTIYLAITVICACAFRFTGIEWFDSINYSMTTASTGGFSPHNESIAFVGSPASEYVSAIFQFLSGMNFLLLYSVIFKGKIKSIASNTEFKFYVGIIFISTLCIALMLAYYLNYDVERAFRSALCQVISFTSSTAIFTDDIGVWPGMTWVVLMTCMFIGGCGGSTSGGLKCMRATILLKITINEFKRLLHPNAVLPIVVNKQSLPQARIPSITAFFMLYIMMCIITMVVMTACGVDAVNALTIAFSLASNAGVPLDTGIGPAMTWAELPIITKWLCSILMLVGRLEIISVLVLFTKVFWKDV